MIDALRKDIGARRNFLRQTERTQVLSATEILRLNNISDPLASFKTAGDTRMNADEIAKSLKEIRGMNPVEVQSRARAIFEEAGIPNAFIASTAELLHRYRYDQPLKTLERLTRFPVVVGRNQEGNVVAVLPEYHDVHGAGEGKFVYGNCAMLAVQFGFQLNILGMVDEVKDRAAQKGFAVRLTVNDGKCQDLFNGDGSNHWFCDMEFKKGDDTKHVILDPSFQRITGDNGYTTADRYSSDRITVPRESATASSALDLSNLSLEIDSFACSFNKRLSFGVSFHEYKNTFLPVLSVSWDTPDANGHTEADIFIDPQTKLPACDRSITTSWSIAERLQVVQCLYAMQKFDIKAGDANALLNRDPFVLMGSSRAKSSRQPAPKS